MITKIHEHTCMSTILSSSGKKTGIIKLEHLAKPESVAVYLNGYLVNPQSFDIYGQPIIAEEMCQFFTWKYQETIETTLCKEIPAVVIYEPDEFSVAQLNFDSVAGISRCLNSMKSFTEMLNNRKRYFKANSKKGASLSEIINSNYLGEYVIWGKFILDKFASISKIEASFNVDFISDVCDLKFFESQFGGHYGYGTAYIPEAGAICPICGREFSIYDMQTREITQINGKYCHNKCKEEYYDLMEKNYNPLFC